MSLRVVHYDSGHALYLLDAHEPTNNFMRLFRLGDHEKTLNEGRFLGYVEGSLEHAVSLPMNLASLDAFENRMSRMLEWCASNARAEWTVRGYTGHFEWDVDFLFREPEDAAAFALVWR